MPSAGFRSLSLDADLLDRVDEYVQNNRWGYNSRAEVVTAAVREFLRREAEADAEAGTPSRGIGPETSRDEKITNALRKTAHFVRKERQEREAKRKGEK